MKILLRQDAAQAEEERASRAVAGLVKSWKFIDVAPIVDNLLRTVSHAKMACCRGEGELRDAHNMIRPINVGLHLAEVFFYFAGLRLSLHQEIEIVDGQHYPRVTRRGD